jgi:hypothetical protein
MPRHLSLALVLAAISISTGLAFAAAAPAKASKDVYYSFRMPSKNIFCAYVSFSGEPRHLRCDIYSGIKPRPPKSSNPECRTGKSVGVNATGKASYLCVSDSVYNERARVLEYGTSWNRGGFSCRSRKAGLTCKNRSSHGFFLSRERSYLF